MGEKEQGGMIHIVVIIGLITMGLIGLYFTVTILLNKNHTTTNSVLETMGNTSSQHNGDEVTNSDFDYHINDIDHTVSIVGWHGKETNVNVPKTLVDGGVTYKVTNIGNAVFQSKPITSVDLPDGLETISENAFQNSALKTIDIPNSVISIGDNAFQYNQLQTVDLKNVTNIGNNAFANNQLKSIDFKFSNAEYDASTFDKGVIINNQSMAN